MKSFKIDISILPNSNIGKSVSFSSNAIGVEEGELLFHLEKEETSSEIKTVSSGQLNSKIGTLSIKEGKSVLFSREVLFYEFFFVLSEKKEECKFIYKFKGVRNGR